MSGFQGSNFGGHAPIVNAKVFLLQAGTSGYGSKSTSLLQAQPSSPTSSQVRYPTAADTAIVGSSGTPAYYVTTDSSGVFNITGDYTCTAGLPVYLYAYAGAPDTSPSVAVSNISSASGSSTTGNLVVTFYVDSEKFYVGQQVLFGPVTGSFAGFSGTTQTVSAVSASDNASFSVTLGASSSTYAQATATGTVTPVGVQNPGIVNLAVLGNCPASAPFTFGSDSSSPISFVYMNEVSTVATAFALEGFASNATTTNGVVTTVSTDAQHIGIPAITNALALKGIQNAAVNAGQLYDITGGNNACGSTPTATCANGEAHVARQLVPGSNAITAGGSGQASVPQALLDTLGNILAACVDSNNTYGLGATGGTKSPQCATLFSTATGNGTTTGVQPAEIATAAINIAHYPAGAGNSSFMSSLYNLPSGVAPFSPGLTAQPNDFMVGLNITVISVGYNFLGSLGTTSPAAQPNRIDIGSGGSAFVTTTGCSGGCTLQILATQILSPGEAAFTPGAFGVAVSANGLVWVTNQTLVSGSSSNGYTVPTGAFYVSSIPIGASTFTGYGKLSDYTKPTGIALDGYGYAYIADSGATYIHKITALGTSPAVTEYYLQGPASPANCEQGIQAVTIDGQSAGYNVWTVSSDTSTSYGLCEIQSAATNPAPALTVEAGLGQVGNLSKPNGLVLGANGDIWITNKGTYAEQFAAPPSASAYGYLTGGGSTSTSVPRGISKDGDNNIWITDSVGNTVSSYRPIKTASMPNDTVTTPNSPSTGYNAGGLLNTPTDIAVDPSGNVWVLNIGLNANAAGVSYSVTELIGAAAPAYTSVAAAGLANKLGQRP